MYPLPPPILEIYYTPSCAPCQLELPIIAEISKQDGVRLRIVILNDPDRAMASLNAESHLDRYAVIAAPRRAPRDTLRQGGDPDGILPYARSITADGKTCAQWRGRLTVSKAKKMLAACKRAFSLPPAR